MFTTLIVQPIFNLLVLIYALIPGHNFGLAIILFTILIRLLMWPLVKKQLHHAKAMRALQPEVKKIKKAAKGDRQQESRMLMELYKERAINPFSSLGVIIIQLPILLGLYSGLVKLLNNKQQIIDFSYPAIQNLPWMQTLAGNIHQFDNTLFGVVDLGRKAIGNGGVYWPALIIVVISAVAQYYQSKQLLPTDKDARSLRSILKDAGKGSKADQSEVSEAVGRGTVYLVPFFVLVVSIGLACALPLYWLVSSIVAIVQQTIILRDDGTEMEAMSSGSPAKTPKVAAVTEVLNNKQPVPEVKAIKKPLKKGSTVTKVTQTTLKSSKNVIEGEVVAPAPPKTKPKNSKTQKRKRRKR